MKKSQMEILYLKFKKKKSLDGLKSVLDMSQET